ncbi:DUF3467 domain-containing protein [Fuerstiella marisgermanici]|uniref:DUF3467 domain-containing protein n=1 Tax=Fuerstiella marisgermanici TaxID=1891926 RepID=A0A1P8WC79_9PLAN|nr:DUF3467 domain-containing protein [Fuerstiella marisgermanici]APZ91665.1 hypothetical protein Fuma_01256 [Fuerstiella marisgermanici]
MSDDPPNYDENENENSPDQPQSQEVRHSHVGALVPAHVARGIFSTGAVVLQGQHEFIVDFLLRMQQPQQVAARIIMPPAVVAQFIQALQENIRKHEDRFGPILLPTPPVPPPDAPKQSAQDLYDQLKLSEETMSGVYANAVMIGHTASEFSLDFITTFFPRSAVSSRVFVAAPNAKRLLDSLKHSFQQFQQKPQGQPPGSPPPPPDPPPDEPPYGYHPENN